MFKTTIFLIFWISYFETILSLPVLQHETAPEQSSKRSNRDEHPLMTQAQFHPFLRKISDQSVSQPDHDQKQPVLPSLTVVLDDNSTSSDSSIFAPSVDDRPSVVPAAGAVAFDNPNLFLINTNVRPADDRFLVFTDSQGGSAARPSANKPTPPSQSLLPPVIGPLPVPSSPENVPDNTIRVKQPTIGLLPPNTDIVRPPVDFPEEKTDDERSNDPSLSSTDVQSSNPTPTDKEVTLPSNELLPPLKETFPPSTELLPPDNSFYFATFNSNWASSNNYSYQSSFPVVVPFSVDTQSETNAADKSQRSDIPAVSNFAVNSSLTGALYPLLLPPPVYVIDESQNEQTSRIGANDRVASDVGEIRIIPKKSSQPSPADGKFEPIVPNSNIPSIVAPSRFFLPPFVDEPNREAIVEIRPPSRTSFVKSDAIPRSNLSPVVQPPHEGPLNRNDFAAPITDNESTSTTEKLVLIPAPRFSQATVARKEAIVERRPPTLLGGFAPMFTNGTLDSSANFGAFKNVVNGVLIEDGVPFARLSKPSSSNTKSAILSHQQRRPNVVVNGQHSPKKDVEVFAPLNPDGAAAQPPEPMPPYPQQPPVVYPVDEVFPPLPPEEMPAYPPFFTDDQPAYPTMQVDETTSRGVTTEENTRATEETTPRTFATRKPLRPPITPTFGRRYTVPTYSTYAPRFTPFTQYRTPYYTTRYYPGYPPTSKPPKVPPPIWPSYTPRPFGQVNADLVAGSPQETIVAGSTAKSVSEEVVAPSQTDIDPKYKLAVVSDYRNYDVQNGTFGFSINLENGLTAKVRGYKKDGKHVIEGSYSLFANEGEPVNITYVADNEGFDVGRIPQ